MSFADGISLWSQICIVCWCFDWNDSSVYPLGVAWSIYDHSILDGQATGLMRPKAGRNTYAKAEKKREDDLLYITLSGLPCSKTDLDHCCSRILLFS
jgi:hypothetical protein